MSAIKKTFNSDRAVPYYVSLWRLSEISAKHDRDLTSEENQKCKKDAGVFDGTDCISRMLECLGTLKGEPRKIKNKIVEYELQLIAYDGSAFDTYVVLNNLSNWQRKMNIVKNGKGTISSKKI